MEHKIIDSDVLIIGGGTAGCYAAIYLGENSDLKISLVDKANINRSGCLAAGVNALNAYITPGHSPMDYVKYALNDADGIAREDLLLDISERFNKVTADMEKRGLTILKDENGKYISRGWRNLKINGENIKPLLAHEVRKQKNVAIYEHVNITDFIVDKKRIMGAYGFGLRDENFYEFRANAVLISTGGASGIFYPNNPENPHQIWYSPFNTGTGYCAGILAGAEMTSFELRFIALRCKDTIAPTGTLAIGVGARQINSFGEIYEQKYGLTTMQRLSGTVQENRNGRGPCYLKTSGINATQEQDLYKAYLNMAPVQTLRWIDSGDTPSKTNVEISGTEPYIVGGHTASGYWIRRDRMTTLEGLFAAGDVAGGAPQKYITGALAEGEIAAENIIRYVENNRPLLSPPPSRGGSKKSEYERYLAGKNNPYTPREIEVTMQKIMDEYAGGISTDYIYNENGLKIADEKILSLMGVLSLVKVEDMYDLLALYEIRERLIVARVVTAHLMARFNRLSEFPSDTKDKCFINSVMDDGQIKIIFRRLEHEHSN